MVPGYELQSLLSLLLLLPRAPLGVVKARLDECSGVGSDAGGPAGADADAACCASAFV